MQTIKWITAVAMMFFGVSISAMAEEIKIGVIDTQKIINASRYGKSAKEEIQKKIENLSNDLQNREAEIMALKEKIEREALVMSPEMRDEKEREYRIKVGDFQAQEKKAKQEMAQLNMKLSGRIQQDVVEIVEGIGKKGGYTFILEKGSLMYYKDVLDISDQVIEIYNKNYEKDIKPGTN